MQFLRFKTISKNIHCISCPNYYRISLKWRHICHKKKKNYWTLYICRFNTDTFNTKVNVLSKDCFTLAWPYIGFFIHCLFALHLFLIHQWPMDTFLTDENSPVLWISLRNYQRQWVEMLRKVYIFTQSGIILITHHKGCYSFQNISSMLFSFGKSIVV